MKITFILIISYLLGCINSAYYYGLWKGKNIFRIGSQNGGATNISRIFGLKAALLVFLVDVSKTLLALLLAEWVFPDNTYILGAALFAVVAGHIFPIQIKFRGGKGVACLIGAGFYVLSWQAAVSIIGTFLIFYSILKLVKSNSPYKQGRNAMMFVAPVALYLDKGYQVFLVLLPSLLLVAYKTFVKKSFSFKIADTPDEFSQIDKLNYETFAEEIPQHSQNQQRTLRDKFHDKNTYIICKHGAEVAAMMALNMKRPFSLDSKVENLDKHIPAQINKEKLCEVRLLSIKKDFRKGRILQGLIEQGYLYIKKHGIEALLISGTTRELKMYKKFGFSPFYKLVGHEGAMYQPMILIVKDIEANKWKK